ncbi:MAG: ATP-binding protein [Phycisphaerales bacterium]
MLVLTVIQGPDKGKTYELPDDEPQLVGRSSEALPMTDSTVSRRHAELTPDEGQWWLSDLGSQNGTWVNGVRIGERTRLKLGDQIRTGATLFVFGTSEKKVSRVAKRVRLLRSDQVAASVERTLASNEDSVIMSEPEPRQSAIDHLRIIYKLVTLTGRPAGREELLEGVMDLVFSEFGPERGVIMMADPEDPDRLEPAVVRTSEGEGAVDADGRVGVSRTIIQTAVKKGEGILSSNAMSDPRFAAGDSVARLNIRSAICSPIKFRERTFGALYIDSSMANYTFTAEQLALMNAIGQHTGLALANAEMHEQKIRGERLAAMGETVASLSHSIKNILQGLRGGADVVEMGLKRGDVKLASGGWGILKRNLDRIINLTMNMLAYSRPRELEIELTRLGPLIEDCASLLKDQCDARGVALLVDAEADMAPVPIDSGQVHQALMNLLSNALDAVEPQTGVVTVRAAMKTVGKGAGASTLEAQIVVIDNGPGIPPEKIVKIFEPFFTTKGLRGTGLGLAVSKRVVEQHGGTITVKSVLGKGAAFLVSLPAERAHMDPAQTATPRAGEVRGLRDGL